VRVSTRESKAKGLKLIAATVLGLDALTFLVATVIVIVVEGYDDVAFVPFVVIGVLSCFGWLGLRSAGWAGGCLLPIAFVGFWFAALNAALAGVSLALFLLYLVFWSLIPLIAGILFLIARRIEGRSIRPEPDDRADLW
jgi:hypothetical protein